MDMFKMWVFKQSSKFCAGMVVTWAADGLGLNIPAVPTADWKTTILLIYYTAVILVILVCSVRK
jgi:hypothetical protein